MAWHYRGTPYFLARQAKRLGSTQILADRAAGNREIYRISVLIGQLCERWNRARKEDGRAVIPPPELAQVAGTLHCAEQELQKLHMLAAASDAMLAEAYGEYGIAPPSRPFVILADSDDVMNTIPANGSPKESLEAVGSKQ